MNLSPITSSLLREKAAKRNIKNIAKSSFDIQIAVFRETLTDLEKYLDVGDLRQLTPNSLGVILSDLLEIIDGFRNSRNQSHSITIKSIDGTLDKLRQARNSLQVAIGMFNSAGQLNESKSKNFFSQMDVTRKYIDEALVFSQPRFER